MRAVASCTADISIPTGTIKSEITEQTVLKICKISIPTGTIKSRLYHRLVSLNIDISIPTGTIKSIFLLAISLPYLIFQFLLVRLKATSTSPSGW